MSETHFHRIALIPSKPSLAIFAAASGHSGIDRIMENIIPAFTEQGIRVDLLQLRRHGSVLDEVPSNLRIIDLGVRHLYSGLFPLVRSLRSEKQHALLSDKDQVNRIALLACNIARVGGTRVVVRTGMTVSRDFATRGLLERRMHYLSMRYLYRRAHMTVVPSRGATEDLATFARIPPDQVTVVPSPVVTPTIINRCRQPVILAIGELSAHKDFKALTSAFALVRENYPCRLLILGDGRQWPALEVLSRELGVGEDVALSGFARNPYAFMARTSAYVHLALIEGAPVALMEALSLGVPVVSIDRPNGPKEILDGGRYGKLVPTQNAAALAADIADTLENLLPSAVLKQAAVPFSMRAVSQATLHFSDLSIVATAAASPIHMKISKKAEILRFRRYAPATFQNPHEFGSTRWSPCFNSHCGQGKRDQKCLVPAHRVEG
jgi:glycosyltransferase involved in cell wall biosynthesis